ncbi:MAG: nicotinamide-nucleotide adenylyltransferase [Candidatus Parvarchaeota archaeon]|nr:nicotinamide-nucleotide adenylyltransferase [Candidatus Jingweiarchaeum tengchongense]MCW1298344.1 nicotinamide-nucleotide adenylyltransferase [Candidatus Jingweiarchaeum tengchongense]MCW1310581.1 nicotinamide-nucleotide adenylyltransferase [Candidatus Jingweiarchaeum tengchongense]
MRALFVGRFQPFHYGHLEAIKNILKECDEVIIVVGSSQFKNTIENPFSAMERIEMIKRTLNTHHIKQFRIIKVKDFNDDNKWVETVIKKSQKFDVVYSNNTYVREILKNRGYKIRKSKSRFKINGTNIRRMMINNKNWQRFVPKEVIEVIKKVDGVKRVKNVNKDESKAIL